MSRPVVYKEPRINVALRLPPALHERLRALADERDVSSNWLVTRAIERYLDTQPEAEL